MEIISLLHWGNTGDDAAVIEPAAKHLADGPVRHIFEFADWLSEKLFALDGLVYAQEIGEDRWSAEGCFSVDALLYARSWVVANGRELYQKVWDDPKLMPKDLTLEALLYLPSGAYERKTGKKYDYSPAFPIETYSNRNGWKEMPSG